MPSTSRDYKLDVFIFNLQIVFGSLLPCHILAHMCLTDLPNQILGRVANFIIRPAWLVTSLMLITCVHRVAAHAGNKKKTNDVAPEIHLQRLRHSSLVIHLLPLLSWLVMYYSIGIGIQYVDQAKKKKNGLVQEESEDNALQPWKCLGYPVSHLFHDSFAYAALFEEAKFRVSCWGNSSMACP